MSTHTPPTDDTTEDDRPHPNVASRTITTTTRDGDYGAVYAETTVAEGDALVTVQVYVSPSDGGTVVEVDTPARKQAVRVYVNDGPVFATDDSGEDATPLRKLEDLVETDLGGDWGALGRLMGQAIGQQERKPAATVASAVVAGKPQAICKHCAQQIRLVAVEDVLLPPTVSKTEDAGRMWAEIREEVGEQVWETTETRRYTCASASVWHQPADDGSRTATVTDDPAGGDEPGPERSPLFTEVDPQDGPGDQGAVGGDIQVGTAWGRRFHHDFGDGTHAVADVAFYLEDANAMSGEAGPDLRISRQIDLIWCADPADPGSTQTGGDVRYQVVPLGGREPTDELARELCAAFDPALLSPHTPDVPVHPAVADPKGKA